MEERDSKIRLGVGVTTVDSVRAMRCVKNLAEAGTSYPFDVHVVHDNPEEQLPTHMPMRALWKFLVAVGSSHPDISCDLEIADERRGVAWRWNELVEVVESNGRDYVAIFNDDICTPGAECNWLAALIDRMDADHSIGILSPDVISPPECPTAESYMSIVANDLPRVFVPDTPAEHVGMHGCFFFIRLKAMQELADAEVQIGNEAHPGRFDQAYPCTWEDTDYVYRMRNRTNYRVVTWPGVRLFHEGSQSVNHFGDAHDNYRTGMERFIRKFRPPMHGQWTVNGSIYRYKSPTGEWLMF